MTHQYEIDGGRESFRSLREVREHIELKCVSDRNKFDGELVWRYLDGNGSYDSWRIEVNRKGRVHFREKMTFKYMNGQLVRS